jgi:hypothetical protein
VPFNLSTPYVKDVVLTEHVETIVEVNATKPGSQVIVAGFERSNDGILTRSKSVTSLKVYPLTLTDVSICLDRYSESYQAYYFDILCGASSDKKIPIPCHLEGAGMVARGSIKTNVDPKPLESFYLFGVYSSNTARAKTEGTIVQNNRLTALPCTADDFVFFTKLGYLGRWGISHSFCDADLAMCRNDRCRPWSDLCNGKSECEDGSDESRQACFNQVCAPNQFKCKYGACIDKSKTCDGSQECNDGSDEDVSGICKDKVQGARISGITCRGIPETKGVVATCTLVDGKTKVPCTDKVAVGTHAVLKRNEVRATCTKDGIWSQNVVLSGSC